MQQKISGGFRTNTGATAWLAVRSYLATVIKSASTHSQHYNASPSQTPGCHPRSTAAERPTAPEPLGVIAARQGLNRYQRTRKARRRRRTQSSLPGHFRDVDCGDTLFESEVTLRSLIAG